MVRQESAKVTVACLAVLAAFGCRTRQERLREVMGHNQKTVFELQSHAGDPIESEAIRADLERIDAGLASLSGDEAFRTRLAAARATLCELGGAEWTAETRRDLFVRLTATCTACHTAYPVARRTPERRWVASQSCGECHAKAYEEWSGSLHSRAWSDPVYRMSAGEPPRGECRSCHVPESVLLSDLDVSYGYRPFTRTDHLDEGVGCASCHLRPDGSVAAGRTLDAPCRPTKDARLRSAEFCGTCHNPTHDAYFEWKSSRAAREGTSCVDCHRKERSHHFPGGFDAATVKRALRTDCRVEGNELVVTLENLSSHKFPGEVPSRVFHVLIRHDGGEEDLAFRRPNKHEIGWKDNRLKPDETRTIRWKIPEGTKSVEAILLFQPSPLVLPQGWIEVDRFRFRI